MKKLYLLLISVSVCAFFFTVCENVTDSDSKNTGSEIITAEEVTWEQIAKATSAEVIKDDANFYCSSGSREIIVDGNKGEISGTYYVLEDDKIYEFRRLSSGVYYKAVVGGGWLPSKTIGEYVAVF